MKPHRVRVALLGPAGRVLLVGRRSPGGAPLWALPGCPTEPGEPSARAAGRLLRLLGATGSVSEEPAWRRTAHVATGGELVRHDEDIHLVRTAHVWPPRDRELWCPLSQLPLLSPQVYPTHLDELIAGCLADGPPHSGVVIGR